jgi:inner membrane protein
VDNLTHTLTAVALSHAGLHRKTRFATLTLIAAANLPDIDILSRFWGNTAYLKYHRGITHSILGVTLLAFLLGGAIYLLGSKVKSKPGPSLSLRWLLILAWIGTASHLLMDFTNSYGVRPFLPFNARWCAWDIMFIFDPLLLLLLCLGLGLPSLLRLVSEEVGARKSRPAWGAIFSLCGLLCLWGWRDVAHRRVLGFLEAHTYSDQNPLHVGAFPSPYNPFAWTGVVETDTEYDVLPASALDGDVDPHSALQFHKPEDSPAIEAALKTRTGQVFMDFARFPWAETEENEEGFDVQIRDLRFYTNLGGGGFRAQIEMDKDLHVRSESFSFGIPTTRRGRDETSGMTPLLSGAGLGGGGYAIERAGNHPLTPPY